MTLRTRASLFCTSLGVFCGSGSGGVCAGGSGGAGGAGGGDEKESRRAGLGETLFVSL